MPSVTAYGSGCGSTWQQNIYQEIPSIQDGFLFMATPLVGVVALSQLRKNAGGLEAEMPYDLPKCIRPTRVGWDTDRMNWSENTAYDMFGCYGPIVWQCDCGSSLFMEVLDYDTGVYTPMSEDSKVEFLSKHTQCTATCYECRKVPVERYGLYCPECEESTSPWALEIARQKRAQAANSKAYAKALEKLARKAQELAAAHPQPCTCDVCYW